MCECLFCHQPTNNPNGFCSPECYDDYLHDADALAGEDVADEDDGICPECGKADCYGECQCDDEPLGMTDVEADADTLASAGWGTDEDYDGYSEPFDCDLYGEC